MRSRSSTSAWHSRPSSRTSESRARGRPSARSTTWPPSRRGTAGRRASRATSTRWAARFYYLLTGIPPYPGGDITDKLTRHAKSPPPDVRDLRPDVPASLAAVMLRMMAKRPEDRFACYGDLIAGLDRVVVDEDARSPSVALVPIEGTGSVAAAPAWDLTGLSSMVAGADPRPPSSIPEISLANLPPDLDEPVEPETFVRAAASQTGAAGLRRAESPDPSMPHESEAGRGPITTSGWIAIFAIIGVSFVASVIAIDRFVRSSPAERSRRLESPDPADDGLRGSRIEAPEPRLPHPPIVPPSVALPTPRTTDRRPPAIAPPEVKRPPDWVEPEDHEEIAPQAESYSAEILRQYLPEWALSPVPARLDGRTIVVRRVVEAREPSTVPSLRMALDETRGTTEIADEGPFLINDFRIPGETRILRARPGFRPIIRIERPTLEAVRSQPGVIELKGKSLTLDSLDLILDVSNLPSAQGALFSCVGVQSDGHQLHDHAREPGKPAVHAGAGRGDGRAGLADPIREHPDSRVGLLRLRSRKGSGRRGGPRVRCSWEARELWSVSWTATRGRTIGSPCLEACWPVAARPSSSWREAQGTGPRPRSPGCPLVRHGLRPIPRVRDRECHRGGQCPGRPVRERRLGG